MEALKELEELKELVPRESLVYFLMGKVNKKLGNTHLALMNFSWAMDLDPKGANNQIKVRSRGGPGGGEQMGWGSKKSMKCREKKKSKGKGRRGEIRESPLVLTQRNLFALRS